ncbi:MoaD/ThiS family protein [Acidocella sp.]|uniref:MoaD/ThiS family protein n=1 Tax=Acidocella sp. TaxID=50710 RepID=UPI00261B233B|nr:MoaD/ThiS family protein [Acidocella sp.]
MRVRYFAWLRERVGLNAEEVEPPAGVATPRQLIAWLRGQSAAHADAFADETLIRCVIGDDFHDLDTPFGAARDLTFLPPFTGG